MSLQVFISYSRDDLKFADQLEIALKFAGFSTTMDRHGISGGENWKARLGALVLTADAIVFLLSPSSLESRVCLWEVKEALRLGKRILPVACRDMGGAIAPPELSELNYIFFYDEPKKAGSGFASGLVDLVTALRTDVEWLREHTRLLQRATEWDVGGRAHNRLLSGPDIQAAKAWAASRPRDASPPTGLHLDFIKASEVWEAEQSSERQRQLEERERLLKQAEEAHEREAGERAAKEAAQRRSTDLAKLEAEQARRVAQRTMVGLVIALSLAMAAAGQWMLANRNANAAIEALSALIETASEVVRPIATLDAVDGLIKQARGAMERFSSLSGDPRLAQQRARSLLLLGRIDWERGDIKRMGEESIEAQGLLRPLLEGGDPGLRLLHAESQHLVGLAAYDRGDSAGARERYEAAIIELTGLVRMGGDDVIMAQRLNALADVEQDLGDVLLLKFHDVDTAWAAFEACLEHRIAAAARGAGGPASEYAIAWAWNKHGDVARRRDPPEEALAWFVKARDRIAALGDSLWLNPLWPNHMAVIDNNIGLIYRARRQYEAAITNFAAAEKLLQRVVVRDPKNLYRRTALIWTLYILGEAEFRQALVSKDRSTLKAARQRFEEAEGQYSDVIHAAPEKVQWRIGRLGTRAHVAAIDGILAEWDDDADEAVARFSSAADLLVNDYLPQVAQSPRPDFIADTVEFLDWAGRAAARAGRGADARARLEQAREVLAKHRKVMGDAAYAELAPRIDEHLDALGR